jgi:hypothetical protein
MAAGPSLGNARPEAHLQDATSVSESRRSLAYLGWTLEVSSSDPATLAWLVEFLSPWYETPGDAPGDYAVTFEVAVDAYQHLRQQALGHEGETAESFVRDDEIVLHPVWGEADGGRTMVLTDVPVAYRFAPGHQRMGIVARSATGRPRVGLMRAVREATIASRRQAGALLVHGAAFKVADRVVIVSGPRRTGKTTLLLHALKDRRLHFVANDRVFVRPDGHGVPQVRGMPTIVSLRPGTLSMLPDLAHRLATSGFGWARSLEEARALARGGEPGRPSLSCAQLCELLGVEAHAGGRLAAILMPRPGGGDHLVLERLPRDEAIAALRGSLFGGAGPWGTAGLWLGQAFADRPSVAETDALCRAVVDQVPIFGCELGERVLASPGAMADLVARVSG